MAWFGEQHIRRPTHKVNQYLIIVAIKEFKDDDTDAGCCKTIDREIKMLKMLKSEFVVNLKEVFKKKHKVSLVF